MGRYVYDFAEGNKDQKDLLGGKGANLAEMTRLGLPVPPGVACIDLAVLPGTPSFAAVFDAVYAELAVESATVAREIHGRNEALVALSARLRGDGVGVEEVSHDDFKHLCARAVAVVRTGETSPYSNVILHAGVTF